MSESSPKESTSDPETKSVLSCSININQDERDTQISDLAKRESAVISAPDCDSPAIAQSMAGSISTGALSGLNEEPSSRARSKASRTSGNRIDLVDDDECFRRNSVMKVEPGLVYHSREKLKLKDFNNEVRAAMDVEQFVHQAEIMLDMSEISVEGIVDAMLRKAISNDRSAESLNGVDEARALIFLPGSSMIMARTIQGVSSVIESGSDTGSINYDQSWLCALCNLAQISRRHMIVARFKQPVNLGENAHEARLFMLIVTPSENKATKSALETGRTFSTMLLDAKFRKQLLESSNDTHFRSLMLAKAQELSKAKSLKNRHKYKINPAVEFLSKSSLRDTNDSRRVIRNEQVIQMNHHEKEPKNSSDSLTKFFLKGSPKDRNNNDTSNNAINNTSADEIESDKQFKAGRLFAKDPRTSKIFELMLQSEQQTLAGLNQVNKMNADGDFESKQVADGETPWSKPSACGVSKLCKHLEFGKGLWNDFRRRARYYASDFKDGFIGPPKTVQKTIATIWFLYFGILLPTIAFSSLNTKQTHGYMGDLRKAIIGQAIGGLSFALLGGQPLVIIMTTAPLCLYTKVIHQMCTDYGFHFPAMYAAVGLWNGFFLIIYSLFGFSKLMKWCTRSTEEIFAIFIVIAFISDAGKDLARNLGKYYHTPACEELTLNQPLDEASTNSTITNSTLVSAVSDVCRRDTSLLFVLLMLGTLWLAITLYRFNKTPYLSRGKREILADYALPTAVIALSFMGSFIFSDVFVEKFPPLADISLDRAQIELLPLTGVLTSLGLGFTLSLLFFMDQNISAAMVNAPQNKLKKGCAYHLDLLVVGILNGFLTMYGFPMMHGVLPHSPLHVRCLADIEERLEDGHLLEVTTNVRETRITGIVSHILVLGSLLLIPYPIAYIPTAVLNGLFLYMAVTSLDGLQFFERILLLFTEQSKYPPNHYIRRCPQRKIHKFTLLQVVQLLVMCFFGFSPYNIVEMFFPVIILLMIPFRHKIVPKFIDEKYLDTLDGKHL